VKIKSKPEVKENQLRKAYTDKQTEEMVKEKLQRNW